MRETIGRAQLSRRRSGTVAIECTWRSVDNGDTTVKVVGVRRERSAGEVVGLVRGDRVTARRDEAWNIAGGNTRSPVCRERTVVVGLLVVRLVVALRHVVIGWSVEAGMLHSAGLSGTWENLSIGIHELLAIDPVWLIGGHWHPTMVAVVVRVGTRDGSRRGGRGSIGRGAQAQGAKSGCQMGEVDVSVQVAVMES